MLVEDSAGKKIIIEIQSQWESDYMQRIIWGASKALVESIDTGTDFDGISKVISISILHFDLGVGDDYIYHAITEFRGVHTNKPLIVRERVKVVELADRPAFKIKANMFPEYYLIRVGKFEDAINEDIDQWIYIFKHNRGKSEFRAKNIQKAIEKLDLMKMSDEERREHERYLIDYVVERDMFETAREQGINEGRVEGRVEGRAEGKVEGKVEGEAVKAINVAEKMLRKKMKDEEIAEIAELSLKEVNEIRKRLGL